MRNNDESEYLGRLLEVLGAPWVYMFEAYFDETNTHTGAPFTCMAGYLFSVSAAKEFCVIHKSEIQPLLPPQAGGVFHAAQCIRGYGKFYGLSQERRDEIVNRMIAVIQRTRSYGVVIGVEHSTYDEAIKQHPKLAAIVGSPYSLCLLRCIEYVSGWLDRSNISGSVSYFFESGDQYAGEAAHFLSLVARSTVLEQRYRLQGYAFPSKKKAPPLQAADLFAWEWQRAYGTATQEEYKNRPWRESLASLVEKPCQAAFISQGGIHARSIVNSFYGLG